ncbi:16S rRNA (cytosine(1402)-N(4))-methyltransferase RsmH [Kordiimonas pumila]|uniref:Ribosomal RNA small subunit methyltransferase H n=1 Tax=Kordiimonas pumila TaxID=2161677 RepID=A0ABV7D778_9PROT
MQRNATQKASQHIPVLLDEIVTALEPQDNKVYVDGTFGAGGYTRAILEAADCSVVAIDRDPDAIKRAETFAVEYPNRFKILQGCFGDMAELLAGAGVDAVDGIVLDIGVSSFQIDEAERGFSFQSDGPLDMRMAQSGQSAADVVNTFAEEDIANIIYELGDERKSRRIAAAIVRARLDQPFTRTKELADLVESVVGRPPRKAGQKQVHPATRTFQALRIYVNDELGELSRGLAGAESLLSEGGRLVVVSFHSLEDRIVKQFMAERGGRTAGGSRHMPQSTEVGLPPSFYLKTKGAVKPGKDELVGNARARSSRLRTAVRTAHPAWGEGEGGYA